MVYRPTSQIRVVAVLQWNKLDDNYIVIIIFCRLLQCFNINDTVGWVMESFNRLITSRSREGEDVMPGVTLCDMG